MAATDAVMIVSETLARKFFPNRDALGQRIQFGPSGPFYTVIGVAGDVKNNGVVSGDPGFYMLRSHTEQYGLRTAAYSSRRRFWL